MAPERMHEAASLRQGDVQVCLAAMQVSRNFGQLAHVFEGKQTLCLDHGQENSEAVDGPECEDMVPRTGVELMASVIPVFHGRHLAMPNARNETTCLQNRGVN